MKRIIIMLALLIHLLCPSSVLAGELLIGPSTRVLNQFHGAPMPQGLAGFGGTIRLALTGSITAVKFSISVIIELMPLFAWGDGLLLDKGSNLEWCIHRSGISIQPNQ